MPQHCLERWWVTLLSICECECDASVTACQRLSKRLSQAGGCPAALRIDSASAGARRSCRGGQGADQGGVGDHCKKVRGCAGWRIRPRPLGRPPRCRPCKATARQAERVQVLSLWPSGSCMWPMTCTHVDDTAFFRPHYCSHLSKAHLAPELCL